MEGVTVERVLKEYARIARATTPIEPESPSGNTAALCLKSPTRNRKALKGGFQPVRSVRLRAREARFS